MPCVGGPTREQAEQDRIAQLKEKRDNEIATAGLCAIISHFSNTPITFNAFLNSLDWKEAGITKGELLDWWNEHQKKDAARIKNEKLQKEKMRKQALAKLTPEERELLGLK